MSVEENVQVAPYPAELAALVAQLSYREHEGWHVNLVNDLGRDKNSAGVVVGHGMTLRVLTQG